MGDIPTQVFGKMNAMMDKQKKDENGQLLPVLERTDEHFIFVEEGQAFAAFIKHDSKFYMLGCDTEDCVCIFEISDKARKELISFLESPKNPDEANRQRAIWITKMIAAGKGSTLSDESMAFYKEYTAKLREK